MIFDKQIYDETVGGRLKIIRRISNKKQKEFAKELGISVTTLSDIETDKKNPSFNVLKALADTFEVNMNFIVSGEPPVYFDRRERNLVSRYTFGDDTGQINDMLDYMARSLLVRRFVIAHAHNFVNHNRALVRADMKQIQEEKQARGEVDEPRLDEKLRAEGRQHGILKKARETAKKMLDDGIPIEDIAKYTDLKEHQIKELRTTEDLEL
jgi:transcriptional regulator with XRE-family HTH domain